jgi:hypothetical protein
MRIFLLLSLSTMLFLSGCAGNGDSPEGLPVHCLDKPEPGPCKGRIPKYFYDYPSNTCRMFHYGGCNGHVPFETRDACEDACVAQWQ